ncbi:hypothetical protein ABEB36_007138 [Hypothenemus hampei]|uniref:Gustatory receptor n=1 Tax=Hypothenemus hampei TaxID=57062 RepID=A0ABD1ESX3_HYPHA
MAQIFSKKEGILTRLFKHKLVSNVAIGLIIIFHFSILIYSGNGKLQLYKKANRLTENGVILFVNILRNILLATMNTIGTIWIVKNYISSLPIANCRTRLLGRVTFFQMTGLVPLVFCIYFIGDQVGWSIYKYFVPEELWFFVMHLMICKYIVVASRIKKNFNGVNRRLAKFMNNDDSSESYSINIITFKNHQVMYDRIQQLNYRFNEFCNVLDKFNELFKGVVVMGMICIMMNILYNCTMLIEHIGNPYYRYKVKLAAAVSQPLMAIVSVGQAAAIAFIGESLQEEGEHTIRLCFMILNKLNKNLQWDSNLSTKEQIRFLLNQSKSRKVCLHAGGFFKLNWGILGAITTTVATYSIVIIQFLLKY